MPGPLEGFRVLELTTTVSGPMAAMVLADQGADVIKVEPPVFGDSARYLGPIRGEFGAMFGVLNRNKRSIGLDLKDEREKALFLDLVDTADVLLENYRPGVLDRLGLGYDTLSARNPRLVYASITGYGASGPYRNRRVYDPLIQASVGVADDQGRRSGLGRPGNHRTILFDKVTGLTTAQAITAALLQRGRTGRGQHLPITMLDSALYYTWPDVMWSRTLLGEGASQAGELADFFPIFEAKDGFVSIILVADAAFELLCVWRESTLHQDPRFATLPARIANTEALIEAVNDLLADVTTDEICESLDAFGIPVARVNTLDDVHEDEQIRHTESLVEVDHPRLGRMRFPRPPAHFDEQPPPKEAFPARPAPLTGQHTRAILEEIGAEEPLVARLEKRAEDGVATVRAALGQG